MGERVPKNHFLVLMTVHILFKRTMVRAQHNYKSEFRQFLVHLSEDRGWCAESESV